MTDMIERVAIAIEKAYQQEPSSELMARAAIAAMREPTMEMIAAGDGALCGHIWQAMVDAALGKD